MSWINDGCTVCAALIFAAVIIGIVAASIWASRHPTPDPQPEKDQQEILAEAE